MLLDFNYLMNKYKMDVKGVLHIGGFYGEENELYNQFGIKNKIFFEPHPTTFQKLQENVKDSTLYNFGLGNHSGFTTMYCEEWNRGASNSLLKPKIHLQQYPHIKFTNQVKVMIQRLDDIHSFDRNNYNMINMDVQGYELNVLKGGFQSLSFIDYIITEVNNCEVYENCTLINDLDLFLYRFGFQRMETSWDGVTWGDAFYVRNNII